MLVIRQSLPITMLIFESDRSKTHYENEKKKIEKENCAKARHTHARAHAHTHIVITTDGALIWKKGY